MVDRVSLVGFVTSRSPGLLIRTPGLVGQTSLTSRLGGTLACSPRAGGSHVAFRLK